MANTLPNADALPLRDIHLPEPVSWWPLAPGWWVLFTAVLLSTVAYLVYKKIQKNKQMKLTALDELRSIRQQFNQNNDEQQLIQALSILLRRVSISFYPRNDVASLTGKSWLEFLDSTTDNKGFVSQQGQLFANAPYLPSQQIKNINAEAILKLCETWIETQPFKTTGEQST